MTGTLNSMYRWAEHLRVSKTPHEAEEYLNSSLINCTTALGLLPTLKCPRWPRKLHEAGRRTRLRAA